MSSEIEGATLGLFFAHGVLRGEPAGSADIDLEKVEEPGLDTDGFGDGSGVAVVGGDQAQVGQCTEDGPAGGAGGGGAVAGQAGHRPAVRGQRLADLPLGQAEDKQSQADHGDQGGDAPVEFQEERGDGEGPCARAVGSAGIRQDRLCAVSLQVRNEMAGDGPCQAGNNGGTANRWL
jgi:hypothetical protein